MWSEGEAYRKKHNISGPTKHKVGIYSVDKDGNSNKVKQNDNMMRISHRVDTMKIEDFDDINCNNSKSPIEKKSHSPLTQGDKLIKIKAQRRLVRPNLLGSIM